MCKDDFVRIGVGRKRRLGDNGTVERYFLIELELDYFFKLDLIRDTCFRIFLVGIFNAMFAGVDSFVGF